MPKIPDYDAVSNITNAGYVLGVQNEVVVRFPAETFKGATGNPGATGADGSAGAAGAFVKRGYTSFSTRLSGTTIIPFDATIPQNTEGFEVLTLAFTPTSATNTLLIEAVINQSMTITTNGITALFQDTTVNALAATTSYITTATAGSNSLLRYEMVAGTTSSTTFKIRCGPSNACTMYINGEAALNPWFGGVCYSSLSVTEYTP
jgi:hypothetical protein